QGQHPARGGSRAARGDVDPRRRRREPAAAADADGLGRDDERQDRPDGIPRDRVGTLGRMSAPRSFLFTSESVTEGHPDKIADQISDSVLDAVLRDDPMGRVACETLITTGLVVVAGEITTDCYVDVRSLVRDRISDIGYTSSDLGFDASTCGVIVA